MCLRKTPARVLLSSASCSYNEYMKPVTKAKGVRNIGHLVFVCSIMYKKTYSSVCVVRSVVFLLFPGNTPVFDSLEWAVQNAGHAVGAGVFPYRPAVGHLDVVQRTEPRAFAAAYAFACAANRVLPEAEKYSTVFLSFQSIIVKRFSPVLTVSFHIRAGRTQSSPLP